ncbi:MAG: multidrug efflux pump subunit AcrA (membrane-fusion protein) [Saprospiraceae bacterium]|jgi:multidrug efflux pump subunit AcrA (membrane-fusion protein)
MYLLQVSKLHGQDVLFELSSEVGGTIKAYERIEIQSEISGWLSSFHLREGDFIKKGDLLARLDDQDQQHEIASLEVALADATYNRKEKHNSYVNYSIIEFNIPLLPIPIASLMHQHSILILPK